MNLSSLWTSLRSRWKISLPLAVAGTAVLAWLAFGVFAIQTLFIEERVDEALPAFSAGPGASGLPSDVISEDLASDMNEEMANDGVPSRNEIDEPMPATMTVEESTEPAVITVVEGLFIDRSHPTSGRAFVLNDGSEQRFLRFEDFETDNGPDLNVYLSSAPADAPAGDLGADFIDLGDLKGNIGPQNYEIPVDVDLDEYPTVVVWCVRFDVVFGAADLATAS